MAIRKINPTSPGQRGMIKSDYQEITTMTPEKSLLTPIKKTSGRNKALRKEARRICKLFRESDGFYRSNCVCRRFCDSDHDIRYQNGICLRRIHVIYNVSG